MRKGWRKMTLGDLFEPSNERLGPHEEEPEVFSISKHDGVIPAGKFFTKRVASAKLDDYKLLPDDAWVYSTIHIDEGSIARNTSGADGVVSPMYTVMRWTSERDDPGYAELLLRSVEMLARYSDHAQGSINRRRSLPWKAFSAIRITLPPLDEQRRIVNLIAAVDDAIDAAEEEAAATLGALATERARAFGNPAESVPAGDAFDIAIGKQRSAGKVDGTNVIPYLRSANVELGRIRVGDVLAMHFSEREVERLALRDGDVLVTEGSASEVAVGVPAVWHGEIHGDVGIQNALIRVRAVPAHSIPEFAEHWAFWAYESGTFRDIATGTNIKHVGVERAKLVRVTRVDVADQPKLVAYMSALRDSADVARTTADALRTLRSNLLTVLLSGEHEVPASYDALLEEVA